MADVSKLVDELSSLSVLQAAKLAKLLEARWLPSKVEEALAAFEDASKRRMADANAANAPEQPLFHYTRAEALTSIIDSKQFWFTSIYHMDDTEELKFGYNVWRLLLQEAIAVKHGLALALCQGLLEDDDFKRIIKESIAFYSISFGLRDDPQQWNSYGDQGRGVALGLAPEFFSSCTFRRPKSSKARGGNLLRQGRLWCCGWVRRETGKR